MQNNLLENKVAIITGASGGIGSVIAKSLATRKMRLLLVGRNEAKLIALMEEINKTNSEAKICLADLQETSAIETIINTCIREFSSLDILINNAGLAEHTPFANVSLTEYEQISNLNSKTPYFLTQKALPYLLKSDCATVINMASVVAHKGYVLQSVYAASKSALLAWSKSFAAEYYEKNIRVHVISPGGVYTDMVALARPDLKKEEMIMPEYIADTILFLLDHRQTNGIIDEIEIHRANKMPFL